MGDAYIHDMMSEDEMLDNRVKKAGSQAVLDLSENLTQKGNIMQQDACLLLISLPNRTQGPFFLGLARRCRSMTYKS